MEFRPPTVICCCGLCWVGERPAEIAAEAGRGSKVFPRWICLPSACCSQKSDAGNHCDVVARAPDARTAADARKRTRVRYPNSVMCGKSNLTRSFSSDTRTTDPPFQVLTEGQFAQVERKVCSKGWFRRSVWWSFCRRRPFSRGFPSQGEIFCCRTSTPHKYKSKGSAKVGFKVPGVAQAHQPPCFSARQLFVLKPNSTTAELARSGHFC